jgi:hypothetical protein
MDKDNNFTEKTLKRLWEKQSGPSISTPRLKVVVALLRHRMDTGAGDGPLGPASWLEPKVFPSDCLVSGKKRLRRVAFRP